MPLQEGFGLSDAPRRQSGSRHGSTCPASASPARSVHDNIPGSYRPGCKDPSDAAYPPQIPGIRLFPFSDKDPYTSDTPVPSLKRIPASSSCPRS